MARRPAVHRRRLRLQLGIRRRPGDRRRHHRHLQGHQGREGRRPHDPRRVSAAEAVLGRRLRRPQRHDHPEAPVRAVHRSESPATRRPTSRPVGTGPICSTSFKPGDLVPGEINPNYHCPNRPYFDAIEMKGGGDAVSAARAVLQTGEYDFAWNMQVEDEILKRLEAAGKGQVVIMPGGSIEHIQLNFTDPWTEVDGERSSIKTKHPTLTDPAVRDALALLVDRDVGAAIHLRPHRDVDTDELHQQRRTSSVQETPTTSSTSTRRPQLLDEAGWKPGPTASAQRTARS